MLQQRAGLPHALTPDSLTCQFLSKVRLNHSDRVMGCELGVEHAVIQKWVKHIRNHYFTTDPFIQRNMNLNNQANLRSLLQQGIDATARDQRTTALYGHLTLPGTSLLVCIIDSRAVNIIQSSDSHLQKRTRSSKVKSNAVQKMTVATVECLPMIKFPYHLLVLMRATASI